MMFQPRRQVRKFNRLLIFSFGFLVITFQTVLARQGLNMEAVAREMQSRRVQVAQVLKKLFPNTPDQALTCMMLFIIENPEKSPQTYKEPTKYQKKTTCEKLISCSITLSSYPKEILDSLRDLSLGKSKESEYYSPSFMKELFEKPPPRTKPQANQASPEKSKTNGDQIRLKSSDCKDLWKTLQNMRWLNANQDLVPRSVLKGMDSPEYYFYKMLVDKTKLFIEAHPLISISFVLLCPLFWLFCLCQFVKPFEKPKKSSRKVKTNNKIPENNQSQQKKEE